MAVPALPADEAPGHSRLHRLQRPPGAVADAWRSEVSETDVERLEAQTGAVLHQLGSVRLVLSTQAGAGDDIAADLSDNAGLDPAVPEAQ